jgi:hypothetical protein
MSEIELIKKARIYLLQIDDMVKICRNAERFWLIVAYVEDDLVFGMVNNDVISQEFKDGKSHTSVQPSASGGIIQFKRSESNEIIGDELKNIDIINMKDTYSLKNTDTVDYNVSYVKSLKEIFTDIKEKMITKRLLNNMLYKMEN